MSILDKIMFWKEKDEFSGVGLGDKENLAFGDNFGNQNLGLGQDIGQTPPSSGFPAQPQQSSIPTPQQSSFPSSPPSQFQPQQPKFEPQQDMNSKNLEIISSKLDAIRASIDSLNQRLANLETIARGEEEKSRKRYY